MTTKPRLTFTDGEKVLCFHGPLLYEAKCLKSQIKDNKKNYFIHYSGWNKNWDEWVPETRVLKYNDINLQRQKELLSKNSIKTKKSKAIRAAAKKEGEKETVQPSTSEKPAKAKPEKRPSASTSSQEQSAENQPEAKKKKLCVEPCFLEEVKPVVELKIDIPENLKKLLLDDWDLITRQQKIVSLPPKATVDKVIALFVHDRVNSKNLPSYVERTIVDIGNRIRDCFNVLLGKMLLYKFERPQYAEVLEEHRGRHMSDIYGAIHLLRMFTRLGALLSPLHAAGNLPMLLENLNDFTKFISEKDSEFFSLNDYIVATPEYHRRAL